MPELVFTPANDPASPLDPRTVCNFILDEAEGRYPITNLALQKLLYFVHGIHLIETKIPLVSGYFEAWRYGPVHPAAYRAFKSAGAAPIKFRATSVDPFTLVSRPIPQCEDPNIAARIRRILTTYGSASAGRLIEIAHAPGAPWDFIVNKSRTSVVFGMRITDDVIAHLFNRHKISVGLKPRAGEPKEDVPFIGNRPRAHRAYER